jgi:hypothetical protein
MDTAAEECLSTFLPHRLLTGDASGCLLHILAHLSLITRSIGSRSNLERGRANCADFVQATSTSSAGPPLKVRQQRLGHSDPSLTLGVYAHVASEDDARVAEQLDGILRPNAPKNGKRLESGIC